MVSFAEWRSHFKLSNDLWDSFIREYYSSSRSSAGSSAGADLTAESDPRSSLEFFLWCVSQGHISEREFTAWLSEKTSLPLVKNEYFEIPVDMQFWERMQPLADWSANCVPLGEWDGHLVVGRLWPMETTQLDRLHEKRIRYTNVLCPPNGLRVLAQSFGLLAVSEVKTDSNATEKASLKVVEKTSPAQAVAPPASPLAKDEAPEGLKISAVATSAEKTPEGASEDFFSKMQKSLGVVASDSGNETSQDVSHEEKSDALVLPDGLNLAGLDLSKIAAAVESVINTSEPKVTPPTEPASPDSSVSIVANSVTFGAEEPSSVPTPTSAEPPLQNNGSKIEVVPNEVAAEDRSGVSLSRGTLLHNFETGEKEVVEKKSSKDPGSVESLLESRSLPTSPNINSNDPLLLQLDEAGMIPPPVPGTEGDSVQVKPLELDENSGVKNKPAEPATAKLAEAKPAESKSEEPFDPDKTQPSYPSPQKRKFGPTPPAAPGASASSTDNDLSETTKGGTPKPKLDFRPSDEIKTSTLAGASLKAGGIKPPPIPPPGAKRPPPPPPKSKSSGFKIEAPPVTSFFGTNGSRNTNIGGAAVDVKTPEDIIRSKSIPIAKMEPRHLDESRTIDEAGVQALVQISNVFEVPMILLFRDGQLLPWKWSDLFLSVKGERPDPIDLEEPSMFKIVFRTAKPYHGYVVTSIVNQKFFNEFYRGMLPKHATIVPIMIEGRMAGMILAFTNSKIDYRQSLKLMERMAFDLGRVFTNLRGTMSKSA